MYFRSTAFWLFWLTFVGMHHNQLNRDGCFGAALKPAQQLEQLQELSEMSELSELSELQQLEAALVWQRATAIKQYAQTEASATINLKVPTKTTTTTEAAKMLADAGGTTTTIATSTSVPAIPAKTANDKKYLKNAKNIASMPDNFVADFKANVAKHFANDAAFNKHGADTAAVAGDIPHAPERRHIVPEKLQYTKEIHIKQGRLMGIIRNFHLATQLHDVDQYLGLPYAEAPVGSRRFMPPGTPLPWQGLKVARHLPPVCPQKIPDISIQSGAKMSRGRYKYLARLLPYLKVESEDCLYLNVYVPREDGLEQTQSYPVIVYIHGESFEWNSGNPYDGSVLASYGQVIVVTVNYRLGALGFLKPGLSENTIANFGLLDQIAALHWIKENINSFGGDKDSVTLMGHSTGAACINYLMISPVSSGLFHRAILMSGSAMSDWAASNHTLQLTMQIAHHLDCPFNDEHEEMLDCLRQKRYQDILKIPTSFPQFSTSLGPIVDGHVIPNQAYKDMGLHTEHFSRYDLLFGVTESESYHALGAVALEDGLRENERDNLLRFYMQSRFDVRPDLALAATLKKYNEMYNNPNRATNLEHRDVVLDILSDARVVGPLLQTGLFHADVQRRNYMYVFGHNSAAGPHASLPHSIAGEELAFVFGAPLAPAGPFHSYNYSAHEKLLAEAVMAYWTNFAKTGNPKAPWKGTFLNLHALEWDRYDLDWPEFNKRSQAYCNIGIPPSVGYKYRQIYMNFWNKELPDELNQIAAIQQQPFMRAQYTNTQLPRGGTSPIYPTRRGGEIIAGHMSKYDTRDNAVEDPLRTLKLLLKEPIPVETAENMYNAPPTFGVAKLSEDELLGMNTLPTTQVLAAVGVSSVAPVYGVSKTEASINNADTSGSNAAEAGGDKQEEVAKSETTLQLLIALIVVFIVLNVIIYSTFLLQKKKKSALNKRKLAGILSYDGATDDELKRSKQTTQHDGDDSYILDVVRKSNTYEAVKMERSPINGYKITRQLSASTVDTHTKVCEWMLAGEQRQLGTLTRIPNNSSPKLSKRSSSPTFSSLRGSSGGTGGSFSKQPHTVSVAVDATPQARSGSVLQQEPIELTKLKSDGRQIIICQEVEVSDQELLTPQNSLDARRYSLMRQHSADTEACEADLTQQRQQQQLHIAHKHSRSDPVEMHYNNNNPHTAAEEQVTSFMCALEAEAPDLDINVTSRDEDAASHVPAMLTPAQQLSLIKRRNYPKVLPTTKQTARVALAEGVWARDTDSPPMTLDLSTTNKRYSLPPNSFLPPFQLGSLGKQTPPIPPPRTISTLGRKPALGVGRRNSNNITTSPVQLAQDCTLEEEEPEITQNTLIVGPIVPKALRLAAAGGEAEAGDANYASLQRRGIDEGLMADANEVANSERQTNVSANNNTSNNNNNSLDPLNSRQLRRPPALCLTAQTAATAAVAANDSNVDGCSTPCTPTCFHSAVGCPVAHHTEKVYTIEGPSTPLSAAMHFSSTPSTPSTLAATSPLMTPTTPTTTTTQKPGSTPDLSLIYAQPMKFAIKANLTAAAATKSGIPRIMPPMVGSAAATVAAGVTAAEVTPHNCNHTAMGVTSGGNQVSAAMTVTDTKATTTTGTKASATANATAAAISRIPQLQRNLSFHAQQQQQQQQQDQQLCAEKLLPNVITTTTASAVTSTTSATTTATTHSDNTNNNNTAHTSNCATATNSDGCHYNNNNNSSNARTSSVSSTGSSMSAASSASAATSTSSSATSSSLNSCSSFSSSSSTGTVRTEVQQK